MFNLGNIALALAMFCGIGALPSYFMWARGRAALRTQARLLTGLMALWVGVASAFQMYNILTHQFQYEYVTKFSDRALPTLLLATTFWGGQSGSFMLWALWSVIFALILMVGLRRSAWEPFVLAPYLLVTVCITGIMWASGPFTLLADVPQDGQGLNPLLQNYWMAIHPPILFTGFTTMAGPFAFAIAALWKRDYDGWVKQAQPWTILAWACLGTGLALGGFWAYESLGWGGFWGWDPVENSSFVPWLVASALLHGLIVQSARGSMKRSNLALAVLGEMTVIYSTFLTRSGILGSFSVHSFVDLGLMNYLLAFIGLFAALGFGMLLWRWQTIGRRVTYTNVISREFGLLLCVVLFTVIMLIVALGTSMPVISLLPGFASQITVDLAWYGPTVAPFGLLLLLTMAVTPLLGWQRAKLGSLRSALTWPAVLTALVLFACVLVNIVYPVALLFIGAAVFAVATNIVVIKRVWRTGPLRLGGYLSHIGVGLLFVGIIGTSVYKQKAPLLLTEGVPQEVFGRQVTFRGLVVPTDDALQRTAVQLEVTNPQDGSTWLANAPYYVYAKTGQLVIHPDIQPGLWSDLYVAPSQYDMPNQSAPGLVFLSQRASKTAFGYTLTFEDFVLPNRDAMLRGEAAPEVQAIVQVRAPDGATTTVTPTLKIDSQQSLAGEPVALPGGATLAVASVVPESQMVALQFGNVDLDSIDPAELKGRLFVEISREPGIKFAWGGIIIGVFGGLLALIRRWREAQPAADAPSTAVPLPRRPTPTPAQQPGLAGAHIESEAHV